MSGKSGSAPKQLAYYGTVAGVFAWQFDWLTALVANGNYIWQCSGSGPLDFTAPGALTADGYVDLTGGLLDPSLIMEGGYLRFYPGVVTANPDPALSNNPAMRDCAGIVAKHIFFGQNSGTAPNMMAIGGHKPVVPISIVAADDNVVDDRQVNPIAALAEVLLDERGRGLPEALFDTTSWLASGHWCAQDQAHRDFTFISPLFTSLTKVRDIVKQVLEPIGGFLRWTKDGKLGCFIYEAGVDPGGLITLDARHWTRDPNFIDADWKDIPTEIVVSFTDRAYEFQQNTKRIPNQRAADIRQTDDPAGVDDRHVTRAAQAYSRGVERMRRLGAGTGKIYVRAPIVADLLPGDKIKVDTNPEPGGVAAAQLARVDKIQIDQTDEAVLDLTLDPLVPATSYTPSWVSPTPDDQFAGAVESAPSIEHMLAIPLPLDFSDWPPAVGFLATRPSSNVNGFHAYFTDNAANPFAELGVQAGFAARCQLVNPVAAGGGTLRLQLLDGADGPDAYIAGDTPGGNEAKAQDNYLFAILVALDGSGRVALDAGGQPVMEFCSILQRSAITADTHDYTVYRGRVGTTAAAWGAGAVAWIIPNAFLEPWRHAKFQDMFGATGYFRLGAFTSSAVDESSPLPETDMVFPSIPTPNNLTAANGTGKAVALNWLATTGKSFSGDYGVYRATAPLFTDWAKIGETNGTRFTDHEVTIGTQYKYKITAITEDEEESAYSNVVTITVAKVTSGEVDNTPPTAAAAGVLNAADPSGTYLGADGTLYSYVKVDVPALPAAGPGTVAAVDQELVWRQHGDTGWNVVADPSNAGVETIRVPRLDPGQQYDIGLRPYSFAGIVGGVTLITGSPVTAPLKSTNPTNPTGTLGPENMLPAVQASYAGVLWGTRATITIPADKDIVSVEVKATFTNSDAATDYNWSETMDGARLVTKPASPGTTIVISLYRADGLTAGYVRIRVKDASGRWSDWVLLGNANSNCTQAIKDMALQPRNNPQMTGVQIGGSSYSSSAKTINVDTPDVGTYTTTGGAAREKFAIDLTGCGLSAKPKQGYVNLYSDWSGGGVKVDFVPDYDDARNSSTQVWVWIESHDGTTVLPVWTYRYSYRFTS